MGTRGPTSSPAPGHDILARYLTAYANARQMSDLERPWGLGDDGLDTLWMRLMGAVHRDPKRLNEMIAEELSGRDREHIASKLAPLIFAIPLRAYPAELRAVRTGPRLILRLRHFAASAPAAHTERSAAQGLKLMRGFHDEGEAPKKKNTKGEAIGYLPAALTSSFAAYLRRVLGIESEKSCRELTVSSGGRRRRVRVTLLSRDRGILIRFLERLPSPTNAGQGV